MNIVRWDPFEEVGTLRRSMDRMLDEFFTRRPGRDGRDQALEWEPAVEMFETDQAVVVRAEMPNIDPKTVDVTVTDGALTLRGETRHEEEHKGRNYFGGSSAPARSPARCRCRPRSRAPRPRRPTRTACWK